ncbi:MAG: acyl-CoA dehydratase activase-related protein [Spirochaetia bacterium]|jgi:predicted nucleotide-binding protein (sugar kinase/HSP70/actin superfamily)|nr:acyl-CoA dehydratase activase-related protein [Spirochaetia bacterium]
MKIGIPRGFYFYLYPGLWEVFFREIGMQAVLSGSSSREIVELAAPVSETEHCLAHKLFDGHLLSLRGKVDAVFIPRILSMTKRHICCAKFGALPDASRSILAARMPVIDLEINETKQPLRKTLIRFARKLGAGRRRASDAVSSAIAAMEKTWDDRRRANENLPPRERFLLLGHPYTLGDAFICGPIRRKLTALGVPLESMTFEPRRLAPSPIRWCTFNKMYHKLESLDADRYAGVIQVSTFNCGADSVMIDGFRRMCRERNIPYLVMMVDAHSGMAGIETRLEAFADSLRWKNETAENPHA